MILFMVNYLQYPECVQKSNTEIKPTALCLKIDVKYLLSNQVIGLMSRVFASGLGDQGSIPARVLPKTQKMVLDAAFVNTQHYKVRIEGKVEQSREWSSTLLYSLV